MNNINIEQRLDTPRVNLDATKGIIEFDGKSYPGDAFDFYRPLLAWMKEYFNGKQQDKTTVNIKLIYFNSATSQTLYEILDIIELAKAQAQNIEVNWYYQTDNKDTYEDYEDMAEEFESLKINAIAF